MKIPKEKRNSLILVGIAAVAVVALLYFFLIGVQSAKIKEISAKIESAQHRKEKIESAVKNAAQIEADLKKESKVLAGLENDMAPASGDTFLWQINMMKHFKGERAVEIPELGSGNAADCNLLPKFPYRQVTLTVGGSAFYHDFGRFLADFENTYPHMRVLNLQVFPKPALSPADKEKIGFKMEIVTLTKPNPS